MQKLTATISLLIAFIFPAISLAQFPYVETFKNATAPKMVISGSAKLTSATGIDAPGQGFLRLTDNSTMNVGYAYCQQAFPSNYGITASFEFFMWKSDAAGYNQADGISFFLFDASLNSFRPGGTGGSLGYAQYYSTPGMAKAYMGVAIDGFGNYSSASDGNKNGGPGRRSGAIAIRGPGNGSAATDYVYQTGVTASDAPYNAGFMGFTQRYPDLSMSNYRKIEVVLTPGSSLGASIGYKVTVRMIKGGLIPTVVTLINNFDYPFAAPPELKFGLAGSTGAITNVQEVRNIEINVTNNVLLLPPSLGADNAGVCQGQPAILDITANDASSNSGGIINKSSIDLNPLVAGQQTTFNDVGKGVYTVDSAGVVTFTPNSGFVGISLISYQVTDNYGLSSLLPCLITVTVSIVGAPTLSISSPAAICGPSTVNITSPLYKIATSFGASYSYYTNLNDATNNTNNINASASAINQSGTYYIRASLLGCATIRPINVQIDKQPTSANAGADQTFCSSNGGLNTTLLATNPDIGVGTWSVVSGPASGTINYPNAATSPLLGLDKGVYTLRWTVNNGVCPASTDDVKLTIGVPATAGTAQVICNATSATLEGNTPSPGIGVWTQTAGSSITITSSALGGSTITGLVPGNSYTLQWKITNGTCVNTSSVTINNVLNTIANAGLDRVISVTAGFALAGNTPGAANTGTWTIVSGPAGNTATIVSASSPNTSITGLNKAGEYVFRWTIANGGFSNFDEMKVSVLSILPVTLVSFEGQRTGTDIKLNWKTASEHNSSHFDVERSFNGADFSKIGMAHAAGNSSQANQYFLNDNILGQNFTKVFYRLKQVDIDGGFVYSNIIALDLSDLLKLSVQPNPVGNSFRINFPGSVNQASLTVYDSKGAEVLKSNISNGESVNSSSWPKGVYHIVVKTGEGEMRATILK